MQRVFEIAEGAFAPDRAPELVGGVGIRNRPDELLHVAIGAALI